METATAPVPRQPIRLLVFSGSLRAESFNTRLAGIAKGIIERQGGTVDSAGMADFACAPFDEDVLRREGMAPASEDFRQ